MRSLLSYEVIFHGVKNYFEHWNCETEQHPEVNELVTIRVNDVDHNYKSCNCHNLIDINFTFLLIDKNLNVF